VSSKTTMTHYFTEVIKLLSEQQIKILLEDIKSVYMVGYFKEDLTTEAEKWGQIQILEFILSNEEIKYN